MLVVVLSALAVISPLIVLRWPAGLLLHRWRLPVLIWGALLIQIVAVEVPLPRGFAPVVHVLTYVVAFAFLWINRSVRGAVIVGAGALSNGVTIALNGGVLPASRAAVEAAGVDPDLAFANTAVVDHPVLPWLGDVFAWPAPLPLANTFSVGDVLIVVGVFVAAWAGARRFGAPAVEAPPGASSAAPAVPAAPAAPASPTSAASASAGEETPSSASTSSPDA